MPKETKNIFTHKTFYFFDHTFPTALAPAKMWENLNCSCAARMRGATASGRNPLKVAFWATNSLSTPATLDSSPATFVQSSPHTKAVTSPPTFVAAVMVLSVIADRASPLWSAKTRELACLLRRLSLELYQINNKYKHLYSLHTKLTTFIEEPETNLRNKDDEEAILYIFSVQRSMLVRFNWIFCQWILRMCTSQRGSCSFTYVFKK